MGRRTSFSSVLGSMAREAARAQRRAEAEHRRKTRAQLQTQKAATRAAAQTAKEAKQRYVEERFAEVEDLNQGLGDKIEELQGVLSHTLSIDDTIQFSTLRINEIFPAFKPEESIANPLKPPTREQFTGAVRRPNLLARLIPGAGSRYARALENAEAAYRRGLEDCQQQEQNRLLALEKAQKKYEQAKAAFDAKVLQRNAEVDELERNYKSGDPEAVVAYCTMVLERSSYPEGFPQEFRVAYVPESRQLVVDYELPTPDIVPQIGEYRYIKTKDTTEEKERKASEIRDLYQDIVASIALRTCHELFESDQGNHFEAVVFNGFVQTVDASTGKDIRPFLISVRATRERFLDIDLSRIDKKACLRNLGGQLSPRPYEVQPVKPIVEFDMVDKRFVEQSDILSDLESRPNLMDLNPFEFENLVSNLFGQMGLETKLTRTARDGGVDAVAFDVRPVIGGKVVIQAKRYKNTVGVSAVRDLYGTMMNEGANKGILVTTSGYGADAFEFSKDKPIELLDGSQLLYLLEQVGVKARIVFPDDWKDG